MPWPKGRPHSPEHQQKLSEAMKKRHFSSEHRARISSTKKGILHTTISLRFWSYVHVTATCWDWTGEISNTGYGRIRIDGKNKSVHRVAWELLFGPIPEGMNVLHRCDNRRCVRADHLWLGTGTDNMQDCSAKGRLNTTIRYGESVHTAKLRNRDIPHIKQLRTSGMPVRQIASLYGVDRTTIYSVLNGQTWNLEAEKDV
jgi:hypothetical protein